MRMLNCGMTLWFNFWCTLAWQLWKTAARVDHSNNVTIILYSIKPSAYSKNCGVLHMRSPKCHYVAQAILKTPFYKVGMVCWLSSNVSLRYTISMKIRKTMKFNLRTWFGSLRKKNLPLPSRRHVFLGLVSYFQCMKNRNDNFEEHSWIWNMFRGEALLAAYSSTQPLTN